MFASGEKFLKVEHTHAANNPAEFPGRESTGALLFEQQFQGEELVWLRITL